MTNECTNYGIISDFGKMDFHYMVFYSTDIIIVLLSGRIIG